MEKGQTTTLIMSYGNFNLEIFPADIETAVPVELSLVKENDKDMAFAMHPYFYLDFHITELDGCSIWHTRFNVLQKIKLRVTGKEPCTFFWAVWTKTIRYSINGGSEQCMAEDYYNLFHLPEVDWELNFPEPGLYETFNVLFTGYDLEAGTKTHYSPDMAFFLGKKRRNEIAFLSSAPRELTAELIKIISGIIRGRSKPIDFHKRKIKDLVYHGSRDVSKSHFESKTPRDTPEMERIREIAKHIQQHPEKTYDLKELSQTAGTNVTKLQARFKLLFGTTAFGYIHEQRMALAHELLKGGSYSVKEVAARTGYQSTQSFSHAFSKYFGLPPSKARER